MANKDRPERNGRLRIPLPFEDAVRAALEVRPKPTAGEPPADAKTKSRKKKRA
jgi:hypothetical protein